MGVDCSWGRTEKMAFEGDEKRAFTAVYDGRPRAALPVNRDARARVAHGAKGAAASES
jgi:hypothetical protein